MAGEYRLPEVLEKLPGALAAPIRRGDMRIALTSQPMHNVQNRSDLNEAYATAYAQIGEHKYANGLRNGSMTMVGVPSGSSDKTYKPGELFFTS